MTQDKMMQIYSEIRNNSKVDSFAFLILSRNLYNLLCADNLHNEKMKDMENRLLKIKELL